jgi:hypothetical protein
MSYDEGTATTPQGLSAHFVDRQPPDLQQGRVSDPPLALSLSLRFRHACSNPAPLPLTIYKSEITFHL